MGTFKAFDKNIGSINTDTANTIEYNNSQSGLEANTVQSAIDELNSKNSGNTSRTLTKAEYDALSDEEKNSDITFYITDESLVSSEGVAYKDSTVAITLDNIENDLVASDNTKFRFATDGEGNYGYLDSSNVFIPFNKNKELLGVLRAGETSLVLTDNSITTNSSIDIYTDVYAVNPTNVTVENGSITIEFKAQTTDVGIKVVIR